MLVNVSFLNKKFASSFDPVYKVREIHSATIQIARTGNRQMVFPTIDGLSSFQVLIFTPNSNTFRASPYLCSCECCIKQKYGSCPLFEVYELTSMTLIKHAMRSENQQSFQPESKSNEEYDDENLVVNGFFPPNSICAIAAAESSRETFFLYG